MALRPILRALLLGVALVVTLASPRAASAAPGGRQTVPVLVPEAGDLQLLPFWVALGGGYFAREGLDVRVVTPAPRDTLVSSFKGGAAPVAVLPGPAYERLVADRFPLLLVANLLQNDPHALVLRREPAERLNLSHGTPVRRRLDALRGIRIGVTVPDRAGLYGLFRGEGLDANIAEIVPRTGDEQIDAFAANNLDAIYVAPLYAAKAVVEHDGVVYVDPSAGEVPALSDRLVQALAVTSDFARARPRDIEALVRAVARAEHVVHFEPAAATDAVLRALPEANRRIVARVVATFGRAVPATPHVEAQLVKREAAFYPVGEDSLDLTGVDLDSVVLDVKGLPTASAAGQTTAASGWSSPRRVLALLGAFALALVLLVVLMDQREGPAAPERDGTV